MEQKQEPQQVIDDAAAATIENYDSYTKQKKKRLT